MLATVLVFVLAKGARFIFANNACLLASKTLFASLTPGKRRNDVIHASMGMLTIKRRKFPRCWQHTLFIFSGFKSAYINMRQQNMFSPDAIIFF